MNEQLNESAVPQTTAQDTTQDKNRLVNVLFSIGVVVVTVGVFIFVGVKQGQLFILGAALGFTLYQASFGFTAGFSHAIRDYRTQKLRAQMLMLIAASILMLPMFAQGEFMGQTLSGKLTPISVALVAGALIFGIGMQLGGGCASGTLSQLGSGSLGMAITLVAFIAGSLIGTFHVPWWNAFPSLGKFSMIHDWGLAAALGINLAIALGLWVIFLLVERQMCGDSEPLRHTPENKVKGFLANNWTLIAGALLLAVLNLATLLIKGKPWGITSGFALWGGKAFSLMGGDLSSHEYWQSASWAKALVSPVLEHSTSIMNFGLILGVWWTAKVSGKLTVTYTASAKLMTRLIIGGFMLGYGARLAAGCNIGAYFSGIASGSLHGWVWFGVAFVGNIIGYRIKNSLFLEAAKPT